MCTDLIKTIETAIEQGCVEDVHGLLTEHPELIDHRKPRTWLRLALACRNSVMVRTLVEIGCNVNLCNAGDKVAPLQQAITNDDVAIARLLLEHGADPSAWRYVIHAVTGNKRNSLELIKLLEEHGADLHQLFPFYDTDKKINALSMAQMWEKQDVVDYLLSKGACIPPEEEQANRPIAPHGRLHAMWAWLRSCFSRVPREVKRSGPARTTEPKDLADEIVAHFAEDFGPVRPQSLIEIVPTEPQIAVHVVASGEGRDHTTMFTTGMSTHAMPVPTGGDLDYQFAELYIQLPGKWPLGMEDLADPNHGWPIHWLRSTAAYPYRERTWLGGPVTIVANGDPPEPLAPNLSFTSLLLFADTSVTTRSGRLVQLYRLVPLYTEERQLELDNGIKALMRAFDAHDTPFVVDPQRHNVALCE